MAERARIIPHACFSSAAECIASVIEDFANGDPTSRRPLP